MLSFTSNLMLGKRLAASSTPLTRHVAKTSSTKVQMTVTSSKAPQPNLASLWLRQYRTSSILKFDDDSFTTRGRVPSYGAKDIKNALYGNDDYSTTRFTKDVAQDAGAGSERKSFGGYERSNSSRFSSHGSGASEGYPASNKYGGGRSVSGMEGGSYGSGASEGAVRGNRDFVPRTTDRFGDSYGDRYGGDRPRGDRFGGDGEGYQGRSPSRFGGRPMGGGGRFTGSSSGDRFGSGGGRFDAPGRTLRRVDFSEENLPPVTKNFYIEDPTVAKMSEEEISGWRGEHNMEIIGTGCPRPIFEFTQASFPPFIQKHLGKLFPSGPSPIQSQGWPLSSSGRDVIASAQTGSGKTIAFVLPALEHIHGQPKLEPGTPGADSPIALFLAPTRELAMQIHEETKRFANFYGYRTACVYGGAQNRMEQTRQLASKPQIVIATPGRLIDFVESNMVNLKRISYVVLDEADRMLDMGFEPQVKTVLGQIRPDRQTLMWSATWPKRVQELANQFLKDPVRIRIGSDELSANKNVNQNFLFCDWNERLDRLVDIIKERKGQKILIFTSTKINADLLTDELYDHGHRVQSLHGDKSQSLRTRILNDFKTGRSNVLIATDVAARGIDVSDIQCVINYNMPNNSEDYVHRIGRTGRAGKKGDSISFFSGQDEELIPELIPILTESGQEVPQEFTTFIENRRAERAARLRSNAPSRRPGGRPGGFRGSGGGGGFRGGNSRFRR